MATRGAIPFGSGGAPFGRATITEHRPMPRSSGSIEVAPSLGLADAIVDITETGETLRANGLSVEEEVLSVSARLIVNKVALKLHAERLRRLIAALRDAASAGRA